MQFSKKPFIINHGCYPLCDTCTLSKQASTPGENLEFKPTGAQRLDDGKARMDLLSPHALMGTAEVLAFGAKKYAEGNWLKGMSWRRCLGSLLRHTMLFSLGEDIDKESGLPHVDHIACNAMFLQHYFRFNRNYDDRFKQNEATNPNDVSNKPSSDNSALSNG